MGPWPDELRVLFVDIEVRQAAAGREHVANGDDVVGGVCGRSGVSEQAAARGAETRAGVALGKDVSEVLFIGCNVSGGQSSGDSGRLVQARGLVAELGVQRAESAIPGGAAGEEQLGKVGGLRVPVERASQTNARAAAGEATHLLEAGEDESRAVYAARKQRVVVVQGVGNEVASSSRSLVPHN